MLRRPDGRRIIFETVDGFRIFDYKQLTEDSLQISQLATGFEFRGQRRVHQTAHLCLSDLAVVNVYDHGAEFCSVSSIDFSYIEKTQNSEVELLSDFVTGTRPVVRAQWLSPRDETERILSDITVGRKITQIVIPKRMIDMDAEV